MGFDSREVKVFSFLYSVQTSSVAYPSPLPTWYRGLFTWGQSRRGVKLMNRSVKPHIHSSNGTLFIATKPHAKKKFSLCHHSVILIPREIRP